MKIIGVGLNKTGTKTLRHYLKGWGFRHKTFDADAFELFRQGNIEGVLDMMAAFDSFEDWPWPLLYREIHERYPSAYFVLTTRSDPDTWYRSLCKMAVRIGPLKQFEEHIYGYAMPQKNREAHIEYYLRHNSQVESYFQSNPANFLKICWGHRDELSRLADFLDLPLPQTPQKHANRSPRGVYDGQNLFLAHINRLYYQSTRKTKYHLYNFLGVPGNKLKL